MDDWGPLGAQKTGCRGLSPNWKPMAVYQKTTIFKVHYDNSTIIHVLYLHMYTYTYTYIYIYILYTYVHMYMYIHIYVYIYIRRPGVPPRGLSSDQHFRVCLGLIYGFIWVLKVFSFFQTTVLIRFYFQGLIRVLYQI